MSYLIFKFNYFYFFIFLIYLIESLIKNDHFDPNFVEKRRSSLDIYMKYIARHSIFRNSDILRIFLETSDMVILFYFI